MTPGVSAGSNHVGAIETVAAKVICPAAACADAGGASARVRTRARADARDERRAMGVLPKKALADPARLRDVEHDAVGARVLHLDVVLALAVGHAERLLDIHATRGAGGRELVGDGRHVFDLEADVVDAREALAALDARRLIVLEAQDGEVDVSVAEEAARGPGIVDLAHLLHPEDFDVELRGPLDVVRSDGDVLELGHASLLHAV